MEKRSILVIVCVVLVSMVLGLVSVSVPKQVRADESPPSPQGPGSIWPDEYIPDSPVQTVQPGASEELKVPKTGTEHRTYASSQIASYPAMGFKQRAGDNFLNVFYGCMENVGNSTTAYAYQTVNLPDGSIIRSIDFSGIDNGNPGKLELVLRSNRYDNSPGGLYVYLTSSDEYSSGHFLVWEEGIDYTVDNAYENYMLEARFSPAPGDILKMYICQVTIYYTPPSIFGNALPMIQR